jgi:hypothetical protein
VRRRWLLDPLQLGQSLLKRFEAQQDTTVLAEELIYDQASEENTETGKKQADADHEAILCGMLNARTEAVLCRNGD